MRQLTVGRVISPLFELTVFWLSPEDWLTFEIVEDLQSSSISSWFGLYSFPAASSLVSLQRNKVQL